MRTRRIPFRLFGVLLPLTLAGYLFANKTFAYLHIPGTPIFIGEIVLLIGAVEAFRVRHLLRRLIRGSAAMKLLLAFVAYGMVRLVLFDLGPWGLDALRDSAIWYYAAFAGLAGAAVLARPELLETWQRRYVTWLPVFLLWTPLAIVLERTTPISTVMPDSDVSIFSFKPGDYAVHAALAIAFMWLVNRPQNAGDARRRLVVSVLGLVAILATATQSRSGMLAAVMILFGAWVLTPARAKLAFAIGGSALALISVALMFDVEVELGNRTLSAKQIAENVTSLAGRTTGEQNLTDTVEWRQALWTATVNDVTDQNFAFGFGFGPNLAARYGFGNTGLRSPHNSHLSILARMGFVGFLLWLLFWISWVAAIERRRSDSRDARLRSWCLLGAGGILVNAAFDPTLEGPQVAIWLWSLVGIAVASYVGQPRRTTRTSEHEPAPLHASTGS